MLQSAPPAVVALTNETSRVQRCRWIRLLNVPGRVRKDEGLLSSPPVSALFKECASIFTQLPALFSVINQLSGVWFFLFSFNDKILLIRSIQIGQEKEESTFEPCNKFPCSFSLFFFCLFVFAFFFQLSKTASETMLNRRHKISDWRSGRFPFPLFFSVFVFHRSFWKKKNH